MAESHKFKSVEDLREVFPELTYRSNFETGEVSVYDEKQDVYTPVSKGDFVVKIADRYEVHDKEPDKAHKAEAPKSKDGEVAEKRVSSEDGVSSEDTPKAVKGNQTVVPEELGTAPGPESK